MQHIAAGNWFTYKFNLLVSTLRAFTKEFLRKVFKTAVVLWMLLDHGLAMVYLF